MTTVIVSPNFLGSQTSPVSPMGNSEAERLWNLMGRSYFERKIRLEADGRYSLGHTEWLATDQLAQRYRPKVLVLLFSGDVLSKDTLLAGMEFTYRHHLLGGLLDHEFQMGIRPPSISEGSVQRADKAVKLVRSKSADTFEVTSEEIAKPQAIVGGAVEFNMNYVKKGMNPRIWMNTVYAQLETSALSARGESPTSRVVLMPVQKEELDRLPSEIRSLAVPKGEGYAIPVQTDMIRARVRGGVMARFQKMMGPYFQQKETSDLQLEVLDSIDNDRREGVALARKVGVVLEATRAEYLVTVARKLNELGVSPILTQSPKKILRPHEITAKLHTPIIKKRRIQNPRSVTDVFPKMRVRISK